LNLLLTEHHQELLDVGALGGSEGGDARETAFFQKARNELLRDVALSQHHEEVVVALLLHHDVDVFHSVTS
jgi:hypothetical protein